jgi:hypothetical protein
MPRPLLRANGPAVNAIARPVQYDSRPELDKIDAKAKENGAKWLSKESSAHAQGPQCRHANAHMLHRCGDDH